mmetsp:Transcript_8512/g.18993  ORF Transcript_8512/g.18993 Transcript_8512/m.18993 type:complete len:141 (-) Transcript_8512:222-644(-)|eukprot:CAMPEP_0178448808 /NCGR_PEP_ID=MMETSP0689_2-20121128/42196_1 /TAXON_ID=160604 /ORGANISM="Amphidinium massartii, Strain CS-259" /LENGTH=140 /DNA_ID=CAMNT_0020074047 /DNA_START=105 /DNA_END=527 /DNA_ORIENTATION=-
MTKAKLMASVSPWFVTFCLWAALCNVGAAISLTPAATEAALQSEQQHTQEASQGAALLRTSSHAQRGNDERSADGGEERLFASKVPPLPPVVALVATTVNGITCQDKVVWIAGAGLLAGAIISLVVSAEWRKSPPESPTI